ncbi:MAG: 4Fe-4S dicluster domain-containing protein [Endomicrobium sp.]|jgi:polyferredoxin|nr:4Fe-4S dicluster domain-containing protein [Endomicrobium sp.]
MNELKIESKRQKIRTAMVCLSLLFFPITVFYFSPYLAVYASVYGIFAGCFILIAAQFIAAFFFGRAFCGWICPCAGIEECCAIANDKKAKYSRKRFVKFFIWIPCFIAIIALFIRAGGVKTFDPLFLFLTDGKFIPMFGSHDFYAFWGMTSLMASTSIIFGRRTFCHTLCWLAPVMSVGTIIKNVLNYPSLKIKSDPSKCVHCGMCDKQCPMNLDIQNMLKTGYIKSIDCIACGKCVDICKYGVLKYGIFNKENSD